MRFDTASGTARCSATLCCDELGTSGSTFKLYVSLEAGGKTAEVLGELHAGAAVVSEGRQETQGQMPRAPHALRGVFLGTR
jgi:hypothetical protein